MLALHLTGTWPYRTFLRKDGDYGTSHFYFLKHAGLYKGKIFVPISDGLNSVGIFFNLNTSWAIMSLIKWYFTCMCLDLSWKTGFLHKWMALWLFEYRMTSYLKTCNSVSNPFSQIASLAASVAAIYSASVVDNATIGWSWDFQLTQHPHKVKT